MSKPTPEQQAAFDAKLAGYKFDTSEYVTLSDKTKAGAMSDIVERLKARGFRLAARDLNGDGAKLAVDAADEITRLRARVAELEGVLRYYGGDDAWPNDGPWGIDSTDYGKVARQALKGGTR